MCPGENSAKTPQTPHVRLPGYPRSTCLCKSAHSASRADIGGGCVLVGSVPLHHEFFNALLLSRNVHSLKLLLIKLFHDQLYRQDRVKQTSILYSPVLRDDRRSLCKYESATLKLLHVLAHSVAAHPDCVADGGIACVTLIRLAVFYVEQITVDDDRSS